MKRKKIAILASKHNEFVRFKNYCRFPDDVELVYIDDEEKIHGYEFITYIILGNFFELENSEKILLFVKTRVR